MKGGVIIILLVCEFAMLFRGSKKKPILKYCIYLIKCHGFIKFLAFLMPCLFKGGIYLKKTCFLNNWQQLQ